MTQEDQLMHVIFVEPSFPRNQREFVRALASIGAGITGIGERPQDQLDHEIQGWLSGYEQISSVCNTDELLDTVRRIQSRSWVVVCWTGGQGPANKQPADLLPKNIKCRLRTA